MNLSPAYKRIKAKKGAEKTRSRHLTRIEKMLVAIEKRFPEVRQVQQVHKKHCEWLLEHWLTASTKKDFRSSLRLFIEACDRDHWLKPLGFAQWRLIFDAQYAIATCQENRAAMPSPALLRSPGSGPHPNRESFLKKALPDLQR